jgi:hypothetical protein
MTDPGSSEEVLVEDAKSDAVGLEGGHLSAHGGLEQRTHHGCVRDLGQLGGSGRQTSVGPYLTPVAGVDRSGLPGVEQGSVRALDGRLREPPDLGIVIAP